MTKEIQLSASLEDYLETIYQIITEKGAARAKDIAERLNVKAGSVTGALQTLTRMKLINYAPYELISITPTGQEKALEIIRKHETLSDFFENILGVNAEIADKGACEMEHSVPDEILDKIILFSEFIQACPKCGQNWVERFQSYTQKLHLSSPKSCEKCIDDTALRHKEETLKMNENPDPKTLLDIETGEKCIVQKVKRGSSASKRLAEMGISRGTVIEVERVAPLGDPIEIKVKGYHLSIRKNEAVNIIVEQK